MYLASLPLCTTSTRIVVYSNVFDFSFAVMFHWITTFSDDARIVHAVVINNNSRTGNSTHSDIVATAFRQDLDGSGARERARCQYWR